MRGGTAVGLARDFYVGSDVVIRHEIIIDLPSEQTVEDEKQSIHRLIGVTGSD
jgi:hypothetical protein